MSPLETLCETMHVTIRNRNSDKPAPWGGSQRVNGWRCTLGYQGRQLTVDFWTGIGVTGDPKAADVLACLVSDAVSYVNASGFTDWAHEFGYDIDSRKAYDTYNACAAMEPRIRRLLGADFDLFARAEH